MELHTSNKSFGVVTLKLYWSDLLWICCGFIFICCTVKLVIHSGIPRILELGGRGATGVEERGDGYPAAHSVECGAGPLCKISRTEVIQLKKVTFDSDTHPYSSHLFTFLLERIKRFLIFFW